MPTAPTRPTNFATPFAVSGTKNTIPTSPTGTNKASFTEGFPPVTMQPISSGGIPPSGDDFNGLFYDYSSHVVWINAGGQYRFDSALSTAMGGYPKGMVLQNNAGSASYISLIDNNTNDFNSDASQIGVTWGSYSGKAFSNTSITTTGGNSTLTAVQAVASLITVTGVLTSNATITIPAVLSEYIVVNSTTGAYTLTVLPSGGAGVVVRQGGADSIYCDGTNAYYQQASAITQSPGDASIAISSTRYADRSSSRVGGFSNDTGAVNAYVIATVPPTTSYANGQTVRFRPAVDNTSTTVTLDAGAGAKQLIRCDGSSPRPGDVSGVVTATYESATDKWSINGLIVPDILISNAIYVTATQTLSKGNFNFNTSGGAFGCNLNASPVLGDTIYGADPIGNWDAFPLTITATGGILIAYLDSTKTLQTMSSLVCNTRGWSFKLVYDGTYWRLT